MIFSWVYDIGGGISDEPAKAHICCRGHYFTDLVIFFFCCRCVKVYAQEGGDGILQTFEMIFKMAIFQIFMVFFYFEIVVCLQHLYPCMLLAIYFFFFVPHCNLLHFFTTSFEIFFSISNACFALIYPFFSNGFYAIARAAKSLAGHVTTVQNLLLFFEIFSNFFRFFFFKSPFFMSSFMPFATTRIMQPPCTFLQIFLCCVASPLGKSNENENENKNNEN